MVSFTLSQIGLLTDTMAIYRGLTARVALYAERRSMLIRHDEKADTPTASVGARRIVSLQQDKPYSGSIENGKGAVRAASEKKNWFLEPQSRRQDLAHLADCLITQRGSIEAQNG